MSGPARNDLYDVAQMPLEARRLRDVAYAEWLARQPKQLTGHAAHRKIKDTAVLMATCYDTCGPQRIRKMAAHGPLSHQGRNGIRLAAQYGIDLEEKTE